MCVIMWRQVLQFGPLLGVSHTVDRSAQAEVLHSLPNRSLVQSVHDPRLLAEVGNSGDLIAGLHCPLRVATFACMMVMARGFLLIHDYGKCHLTGPANLTRDSSLFSLEVPRSR